jgi:hypothetical protein
MSRSDPEGLLSQRDKPIVAWTKCLGKCPPKEPSRRVRYDRAQLIPRVISRRNGLFPDYLTGRSFGFFGVALSQALRARLRSHHPSWTKNRGTIEQPILGAILVRRLHFLLPDSVDFPYLTCPQNTGEGLEGLKDGPRLTLRDSAAERSKTGRLTYVGKPSLMSLRHKLRGCRWTRPKPPMQRCSDAALS